MLYAAIENNIVKEIHELNTEEEVHLLFKKFNSVIDITEMNPQPIIGTIFDGIGFSGEMITEMKITRLALQNRFTDSENIAIDDYAESTTQPYRKYVKLLLRKLNNSTFIDLKRPDTINGIMLLAMAGIITSERANIILNTMPTDIEKYRA